MWNSTCHLAFVNSRLYLLKTKITTINATSTREQMLFNQQLWLPTLIKAVQSQARLAAALLFLHFCYKNISNLPVTMTTALGFFFFFLTCKWLASFDEAKKEEKSSIKNGSRQRPERSEHRARETGSTTTHNEQILLL